MNFRPLLFPSALATASLALVSLPGFAQLAPAPLQAGFFSTSGSNASESSESLRPSLLLPAASYSSSRDAFDAVADPDTQPLPPAPSSMHSLIRRFPPPPLATASHYRPFSTIAIGSTYGDGGLGIDVATPLNTRINLRAGMSYFSWNASFTDDTVPINGTLHLGNAHASVDWFLFGNSFHISPGVTMFNKTRYTANIFVPGGQEVSLNDEAYTSDPNDPIRGTALITMGNSFAPRLTMGFGNMIPHREKSWTFPMEIGFDYRAAPTALFVLTGSSCDPADGCSPINSDPATQMNINQEQNDITSELKPLRFFPIIQFGVAYKFGH